MTEIKINSRPCSSCGHRNVTNNRSCEKCGRMIGMSQNLRLILMGMGVMAAVAIGGLYAVDAFTPSQDANIAPVFNPNKQVKSIPTPPKAQEEILVSTEKESASVAHFVNQRNGAAPSASYKKITNGAQQLYENLNVRISSAPISAVEQKSIEELADELSSGQYQGQTIYLLSFAETVGSVFLAEERGIFVQNVLEEKYGIDNQVEILGFAPEATAAVNPHRLEVWVK
ncbi:MAG: hypothetical protein AB8F95_08705 [Bacteroidia bacterium]